MRKYYKLILILLILLATFGLGYYLGDKPSSVFPIVKSSTTTTVKTGLNAKYLWDIVQEWRTTNSYNPYTEDQELCKYADERVLELNQVFEHNNPKLKLFGDTHSYEKVSENIINSYGEKESLEWWLNSPSHFEALKEPYTNSCIRCSHWDCIQVFAKY